MSPFENDTDAMTIAGLSIENGSEQITMFGNMEIKRDQQSLQHLDALMAVLGEIRSKLASFNDLPDLDVAMSEVDASMVDVVANPFGDN